MKNLKVLLAAALLLGAAQTGRAASRSFEVRVAEGARPYVKRVKVVDGRQFTFDAAFKGPRRAERAMMLNGILSSDPKDPSWLRLEYELSVKGDGARPGLTTMFMAKGSLDLPAGRAVAAVECGDWTAAFAVGAGTQGAVWKAGGRRNLRLTGGAKLAGVRKQCRMVLGKGARGSATESFSTLDAQSMVKRNLIRLEGSAVLAGGGAAELDYDLMFATAASTATVSAKGKESLAVGKWKVKLGPGHLTDFRVDAAGGR